MSFYKNLSCPVCHQPFQEGEDIVTCPSCGTPHHRACYEKLGRCANFALHGTDYSFRREAAASAKADQPAGPDSEPAETIQCAACGATLKKDASYCMQCGAKQPAKPHAQPARATHAAYGNVIGGEATEDVAAVVRTNVPYFIPRFIRNKKLSWNWGAFFFGPYYLFFRKMYKQGALFLAIRLIASLFVQGIYADAFAAFSTFLNENYTALSQGKMQIDEGLVQQLYPAALIMLAVNLVLNLLIAVLCNGFYRKKVFALLQTVDEKLESGGMFQQTPMMEEQLNLSQDEMRKLYLSKIGGTSIFAPITAFFVLDLISTVISSII